MFKKTLLAGVVAATLLPGVASAADAPPSPHTFTGNVGLYSQYIFRGMTQTNADPAVQGGFDYSHSSGFYAGTWASNISWLKENFSTAGPPIVTGGQYSGGGSMEWDFYGGYKWGFAPDWTLDLGGLYYWYPGDVAATTPLGACTYGITACPKADTFELYGGLSWKWLSVKYSRSIDNKTFGLPNSRGSYYVDFTANVPLGDLSKDLTGWTLIAHYGKQKFDGTNPGMVLGGVAVTNDDAASYDDWKLGLSYALPKDFTIGAYYTDTSGANRFYWGSVGEGGPYPRNMAKGTGTIYIQKTF
jgi:uncharacterized protein (TIGR02001 family)